MLAILLLAAGLFSWDRWFRYDDAAEFQGSWQVADSTGVVVIDGESIKLTQDVAYAYRLDTGAKTITFSFGDMQGQGRYRFSLDRTQLVITDGAGYDGWTTLLDDVAWMAGQLASMVQGNPERKAVETEGLTVLNRLSHDADASPQRGEAQPSEGEAEDADGSAAGDGEASGANDAATDGATTDDANGATTDGVTANGANGATANGDSASNDAALSGPAAASGGADSLGGASAGAASSASDSAA